MYQDRDSIRRFIEAKGLVVVNALITVYMDEERPHHDNLLHMIEVRSLVSLCNDADCSLPFELDPGNDASADRASSDGVFNWENDR